MELNLSPVQKHLLSQQMQQSVKILQMSSQELNTYIKDAAMENPVIDMDHIGEATKDPQQLQLKKLEWLQSINRGNTLRYSAAFEDDENDTPLYDGDWDESLYEVLTAQIPEFALTQEQEKALRYIIGNLDESGYLSLTDEQLAADLSMPLEDVCAAMDALHRMEPHGLGARDVRECLLLQLAQTKNASPVLREIIQDHMELLAKNQLEKLAKELHTDLTEVKKAQQQLCKLNPKPGNGFTSHCDTSYINPDLFIIHFQDHYEIILNDYGQPHLEISGYYRLLATQVDSETASYISEKIKQAQWLISCISRRQSTLVKCAKVILEKQEEFFANGPGHLFPMTLEDVASAIEMNESTVSRAVRDKFLKCQWGIFSLADFFSRAVNKTAGQQTRENIFVLMRKIISGENPRSPLSDQRIVQELAQKGVKISRRTVAKYREMLEILPASGRKKY